MADSPIAIVNSALTKVGEDPIADFDEDRKPARVAKRQYPIARRYLLRSYRWNFAIRRVSLAPDATTPAFGFGNRFLLPAKCLHVIGLFDSEERQANYTATRHQWKVEGRYVLFDDEEVKIFYIEDVEDTGQFDAMFDEALALWMAHTDLAYDLSAAKQRVEQNKRDFDDVIKRARLMNAIEGSPEYIEASDWVDSRRFSNRYPSRRGPVA